MNIFYGRKRNEDFKREKEKNKALFLKEKKTSGYM